MAVAEHRRLRGGGRGAARVQQQRLSIAVHRYLARGVAGAVAVAQTEGPRLDHRYIAVPRNNSARCDSGSR